MEFYVANIRIREGLSIRQLAKKSGVATSYIERIEANEANPSIDILCRLAKALQVPVSELFNCD